MNSNVDQETLLRLGADQDTGLAPGPVTLAPGVEVLQGYPLVKKLGRGGFGEVWKALAPGGVPVALKFLELGGRTGEVEARALEFMKCIVHPHLLTTFGIWHRRDLLVIGMELADGTLMDRLEKVNEEGKAGIPLDELREYMREAAKGIDFLNEPTHAVGGLTGASITHRDIKPQNLLLVGGGVKVADFGLARVVEGGMGTRAGGLTPLFAAPEFFESQVARQSDQYSLAVSYCLLRTGSLPYTGSMHAVMAGHLSGNPNLEFLPAGERDAVARALSRHPNDRWPSCREFVRQLSDPRNTTDDPNANRGEVVVDTRRTLGANGEQVALPYTPGMPVWVFLGDVYHLIQSRVEPYTYGQSWVLREVATWRVFDVGSPWAHSHRMSIDTRRLDEVGIRAGMRLETVPLE